MQANNASLGGAKQGSRLDSDALAVVAPPGFYHLQDIGSRAHRPGKNLARLRCS